MEWMYPGFISLIKVLIALLAHAHGTSGTLISK